MKALLAVIVGSVVLVGGGLALMRPTAAAPTPTAARLAPAVADDAFEGEEANRAARIAHEIERLSEGSYVDAEGDDACSKKCEGHEAGWAWARKKDLDDEKRCPAAHGRSFRDGCIAWTAIADTAADHVDNDEDEGADDPPQ